MEEGKKSKEYYKMPVKKSFGAEISKEVAESFADYCDQRGWTKYRCLEASLRIFLSLPIELQAKLMSDNHEDVRSILVEGLLLAETADFLRLLAPEQRKELLVEAKRAKRKVSRKK